MESELIAESMRVYGGLASALEKLTKEASILAEHHKRIREHNASLTKLNASFNQVQSRLERVAAIKPGFSKMHI